MEMTNKSMERVNRINETKEESEDIKKNTINTDSIVNQRITIAGGFLDVALFVADVEHLKFIFDTGKQDIEYYDLLLGLLFTSLTLQILVGVLLFVIGFGKSNQTLEEVKWTKIVNHVVIGLVSMIAITNIFITVFGDRGEAITQYKTRHNCQLKAIDSIETNVTTFLI